MLFRSLDSVLTQTRTDWEILVINDGDPNTPALEAALAPYRDRIQYIVKENGGLASARNAGLRVARGRCLLTESNGLSIFRKLKELTPGHRAAGGGGHFFVVIKSARFNGLTPLARQRLVIEAVKPMMDREIHALSMKCLPE